MAGIFDKEFQEDFYKGHTILYQETFINFSELIPFSFEKWFNVHCPVRSTLFKIRVSFERDPNNGNINSNVLIKRTDYNRYLVDVALWMAVFPAMINAGVPDRTIRLDNMLSYSQVRPTVENFISSDIMRELGNQDLPFRICLTVSNCHGEKDTVSPFKTWKVTDTRADGMLFSNM